jgi:ribosome-binding factor A
LSRRTERVSHELKRELSELLIEEVDDPRVAKVTSITGVDVAPDFSTARVFVSSLGSDEEKQATIDALKSASAMLRKMLAGRMTLRRVPKLIFQIDRTIELGAEMDSLIDTVVAEDSVRARRRDSGRSGTGGISGVG